MKKLLLFVVLSSLLASCARLPKTQPERRVYLVPVLHGLHKTNPNYSYDSLRALVARLQPDVIAVEIRPEDITRDTSYLKQNYPYEMWMMRYWFPGAAQAGFDWLGAELEGKPIPEGYWKNAAPIKQYQAALASDSIYSARVAACQPLVQQRMALLKSLALNQLLHSPDSALTAQYYRCLDSALAGSVHQRIPRFSELRNQKILENIQQLISRNQGKTLVILTGDDHYVYLSHRFGHLPLY